MKREIQVHFENSGQLQWIENIVDVEDWISNVMYNEKVICKDSETGRFYGFWNKHVIAFVVTDKKEEPDLWNRTYSACQAPDSLVEVKNKLPY